MDAPHYLDPDDDLEFEDPLRPEDCAMPPETRAKLDRLFSQPSVFKPKRHDHSRGPVDIVFHRGRLLAVWAITQTLAFPLEHLAWEKAPILRSITKALGL